MIQRNEKTRFCCHFPACQLIDIRNLVRHSCGNANVDPVNDSSAVPHSTGPVFPALLSSKERRRISPGVRLHAKRPDIRTGAFPTALRLARRLSGRLSEMLKAAPRAGGHGSHDNPGYSTPYQIQHGMSSCGTGPCHFERRLAIKQWMRATQEAVDACRIAMVCPYKCVNDTPQFINAFAVFSRKGFERFFQSAQSGLQALRD